MILTSKVNLLILVLFLFSACQKKDNQQLPLSEDNWEKIAPVPNIRGAYDAFSIMTNINKELIVETRPFQSSTVKHYYYDDKSDDWFLINNFKSSNAGGISTYTFRNTPSGHLIAIERYSINNPDPLRSSDSRTAIWNLDNAAAPVKLIDDNIVIKTSYFHANSNGDLLSFGSAGSPCYAATLYNSTAQTLTSIDCSILTKCNTATLNAASFFALDDNFMIRFEDIYYTVNKTNNTLEISTIQPNSFAYGDLDILTDYHGKQAYLNDGTLIAGTGSGKILEWKPGEIQPTVYRFNNTDFNINRSWTFGSTEDDKLILIGKQKSTSTPEDILYLMEKDGLEYGYQKIVSDYSYGTTINGCVTINDKIYIKVGNTGTAGFIAKIDFF